MKTSIILHSLCLLGVLWLIPNSTIAQEFAKKRVAVFSFEDKTDTRNRYYGRRSVGEEVQDMITTELVQSGKFRVIEREKLDALLKEQDLGKSGVMTPQSAAQVGKVLGVELAVMGAVTEMGNVEGNKGINLKKVGVKMGQSAVVLAIDLRIVNTSTGEIVAAEHIRKTKTAVSGGLRVKGMNLNDKNRFNDAILGKVARAVVERVVELLAESAADMPWSAKVITAKEGKVYINSGKEGGVEIGSTFTVYRPGEELIDPDTGLNLGSVEEKIGKIKVTNNAIGEGKASICEIVSGTQFGKGDIVRTN